MNDATHINLKTSMKRTNSLKITNCPNSQHNRAHLNSLITFEESEFIILKPPKKKTKDPDDFIGEFSQMFKGLTPILYEKPKELKQS